VREHPRSRAFADEARRNLLAGVPMHWMAKWPGGFPLVVAEARGATPPVKSTNVGHSHPRVVEAIRKYGVDPEKPSPARL